VARSYQAHGRGKAVDGRDYVNEYVIMYDLVKDKDGHLLISRAREFFDSKSFAEFMAGTTMKVRSSS
jgi:hypothetical protein